MGMAYVRIFYDWLEITGSVDEAAKGRLIDAVIRYARDGEIVDLPGSERVLFPVFMNRLDRDAEKYKEKCERKALTHARAPLRNEELRNEESRNEEPTVLKNDDNWRTSARARGAVAQLIVDAALSENLPCGRSKCLHELVLDAMESGLEPEEILACCREANSTNLGLLIYEAMQARGLSAR